MYAIRSYYGMSCEVSRPAFEAYRALRVTNPSPYMYFLRLGAFEASSKSHVVHMQDGDFYGSEKSKTFVKGTSVRYELVDASGNVTVLKDKLALGDGEILDTTVMHVAARNNFV